MTNGTLCANGSKPAVLQPPLLPAGKSFVSVEAPSLPQLDTIASEKVKELLLRVPLKPKNFKNAQHMNSQCSARHANGLLHFLYPFIVLLFAVRVKQLSMNGLCENEWIIHI